MNDIFLSYASRDREHAHLLATALEAQGWSVFWDRHIPTGKTWHDVLGYELDNCACVVVIWSDASIRSPWVYEEAEEGKRKNALFPAAIDQVLPPLGFRMLQAADLVDWQGDKQHLGFQQLIQDLASHFRLLALKAHEADKRDIAQRKAQEAQRRAQEERQAIEQAQDAEAARLAVATEHKADEQRKAAEAKQRALEEQQAAAAAELAEQKRQAAAERARLAEQQQTAQQTEEARKAEAQRQAAEQAAQQAEQRRKVAEEAARKAEQKRQAAEQAHQIEQERQAAAAQHIAQQQQQAAAAAERAEQERLAAEAERKAAEQARIAEEQRKAEAAIHRAEAKRKAAEQAAEQAEQKRQTAEQAAQQALEEQKATEAARRAEQQRQAEKEATKNAEAERRAIAAAQQAEQRRQAAEQAAQQAQAERQAAEEAARHAREEQQAAQAARLAEQQRQALAETARQHEANRKAEEIKRLQAAQQQANQAVTEAEKKRQAAEDATKRAEEKRQLAEEAARRAREKQQAAEADQHEQLDQASLYKANYELKDKIGEGGMATVYLAVHKLLEREVAVKILAPNIATSEAFQQSFIQEARIVAKLEHPNIVKIYDGGVDQDRFYMAMELLPGGTLKQRLSQGALPPEDVCQVLKQISSALQYAHQQGYIHRDIKPANILFRANGEAALADFGIAKLQGIASEMTQLGLVSGTPHYMSPEQAQGKSIDPRADLYSLGVVCYEMLTGNKPYTGSNIPAITQQHINAPLPQLPAELAVFQPLLNQLLAKQPSERPADASAVLAMLQHCDPEPAPTLTQQDLTLALNAAEQATAHQPRQAKRLLWVAIGLLGIGGIAASGYYLHIKQLQQQQQAEIAAAKQQQQQQAIQRHLESASIQTDKMRLFDHREWSEGCKLALEDIDGPYQAQQSAEWHYQQILQLDKTHAEAKQQLQGLNKRKQLEFADCDDYQRSNEEDPLEELFSE